VSTSYATLLLDPPWLERGAGKVKRGADRHYPLLKTHAMPPVIFGSGVWFPHECAHMYLWVTNNFLPDGLWLMDVLGFRYVTNVVWAKQRVGLGQYFRGQHELLLFGVRKGASQPTLFRSERKNIPSLLNADRGKHSAKPVEAYELIEARSTCPEGLGRLEMFARSERPGWTSWGNEL
jgi:N6-adenosine-specific RNA methylase IME4